MTCSMQFGGHCRALQGGSCSNSPVWPVCSSRFHHSSTAHFCLAGVPGSLDPSSGLQFWGDLPWQSLIFGILWKVGGSWEIRRHAAGSRNSRFEQLLPRPGSWLWPDCTCCRCAGAKRVWHGRALAHAITLHCGVWLRNRAPWHAKTQTCWTGGSGCPRQPLTKRVITFRGKPRAVAHWVERCRTVYSILRPLQKWHAVVMWQAGHLHPEEDTVHPCYTAFPTRPDTGGQISSQLLPPRWNAYRYKTTLFYYCLISVWIINRCFLFGFWILPPARQHFHGARSVILCFMIVRHILSVVSRFKWNVQSRSFPAVVVTLMSGSIPVFWSYIEVQCDVRRAAVSDGGALFCLWLSGSHLFLHQQETLQSTHTSTAESFTEHGLASTLREVRPEDSSLKAML